MAEKERQKQMEKRREQQEDAQLEEKLRKDRYELEQRTKMEELKNQQKIDSAKKINEQIFQDVMVRSQEKPKKVHHTPQVYSSKGKPSPHFQL